MSTAIIAEEFQTVVTDVICDVVIAYLIVVFTDLSSIRQQC
jgi:hypothetical protein